MEVVEGVTVRASGVLGLRARVFVIV